ncbi:mite allergen Der f 3-like [Portunus trituberculatus]|nr:mite allergen Der f 3-like [Portunus trituberculatus]
MKSLRVVLSLLALVAAVSAVPSHRIVGGEFTEEGDFPEMVSVYTDPLIGSKQHLCGGIILNDNHVLTTASCVNGRSSLHVMGAGVSLEDQSGYEEHKTVNMVIIHPDYDSVTKAHDLAILKLSHNFIFVTGLISPAVLPAPDTAEPATGTKMVAVGWGKDGPDGELQTMQKAVNMTYLSRDECSVIFGTFVQPNEGCLEGGDGHGICLGDEGGIAEDQEGTAMALVSWHVSCDAFPAVVTLLAPYHEWITSHFDT